MEKRLKGIYNVQIEGQPAVGLSRSNAGLDLLPCPFCGGDAIVHYLELNGLAVIACDNKQGCGMQPRTYEEGLRYDLAKINWNQRSNAYANQQGI